MELPSKWDCHTLSGMSYIKGSMKKSYFIMAFAQPPLTHPPLGCFALKNWLFGIGTSLAVLSKFFIILGNILKNLRFTGMTLNLLPWFGKWYKKVFFLFTTFLCAIDNIHNDWFYFIIIMPFLLPFSILELWIKYVITIL